MSFVSQEENSAPIIDACLDSYIIISTPSPKCKSSRTNAIGSPSPQHLRTRRMRALTSLTVRDFVRDATVHSIDINQVSQPVLEDNLLSLSWVFEGVYTSQRQMYFISLKNIVSTRLPRIFKQFESIMLVILLRRQNEKVTMFLKTCSLTCRMLNHLWVNVYPIGITGTWFKLRQGRAKSIKSE